MNHQIKAAVLFLVFAYASCRSGCTSICTAAGDTVVFGNNLDWYYGGGMLVVNKRNVSKTGCWFANKPSWTSKYGSITINQLGREFPSRGMNEAGLAVGEMTLSETRFPDPDSRPAISQSQWIQYQLDNCATVDEVIASDAKIRIDRDEYHSHFFVADSTGACVSMEWLNGKLVTHTRETMPVRVLTNNTYSSGMEYCAANPSPAASDFSSLARFFRAAEMIKNYIPAKDGSVVGHAFAVLSSVGPAGWTKWSLVFDLTRRRFHLRTSANRNIRYVDFDSFDFTCRTPVRIFGLDNPLSGDVSGHFTDYTYDANRSCVYGFFNQVGAYVGNPSDWVKETMARYPETTACRVAVPDGAKIRRGLYQNYPNPFNLSTEIIYQLDRAGRVRLSICDLAGQEVDVVSEGFETEGEHRAVWSSGLNSSGVYFYRLQAGGFAEAKKLVLLK
jgi:penicillin V acylase-like amidase (Ntn superfamily)